MVFKRLFRAAKRIFPWKNSTRFSTVVKVRYKTGYRGQYLGIAEDVNPANCYYFQKPLILGISALANKIQLLIIFQESKG